MKSVMMFLFAALVSVSMSATPNDNWFLVYKASGATKTVAPDGTKAKAKVAGYFLLDVTEGADTVAVELGHVVQYLAVAKNQYSPGVYNLAFDISRKSDPSEDINSQQWTGNFVPDASGVVDCKKMKWVKSVHVEEFTAPYYYYFLHSESVPTRVVVHGQSVGGDSTVATNLTLTLDVVTSQYVNLGGYVGKLDAPHNLGEGMAAFELYMTTYRGATFVNTSED